MRMRLITIDIKVSKSECNSDYNCDSEYERRFNQLSEMINGLQLYTRLVYLIVK